MLYLQRPTHVLLHYLFVNSNSKCSPTTFPSRWERSGPTDCQPTEAWRMITGTSFTTTVTSPTRASTRTRQNVSGRCSSHGWRSSAASPSGSWSRSLGPTAPFGHRTLLGHRSTGWLTVSQSTCSARLSKSDFMRAQELFYGPHQIEYYASRVYFRIA